MTEISHFFNRKIVLLFSENGNERLNLAVGKYDRPVQKGFFSVKTSKNTDIPSGGQTGRLLFLVYAMLTLVCQLLLSVYQAMVLYGIVANDFPVLLLAQRHYAWLIDLSSLSGSIFLFAIR